MSTPVVSLPPVKRGDTWSFMFTWTGSGEPINLTECSARMQIRDRRSKQLMVDISSENNITIQGLLGQTLVSVPSSITKTVFPGTYISDVELTFTNSEFVMSSQTFQLIVEEDVTL